MTNVIKAIQSKVFGRFRQSLVKPVVRRWVLVSVMFIIISLIILSTVVTERIDLKVGQVSPKDIQAPHRVINQYQTDALRALESDRAVKEALSDEDNYVINDAVAIRAKDRIAHVFSILTDATAPSEERHQEDHEPPDSGQIRFERTYIASIQADMMNEAGVELSLNQINAALQLPTDRLQSIHTLASDLATDVLTRHRVDEGDIDRFATQLPTRLDHMIDEEPSRSITDDEADVVASIVSQVLQPNLVIDLARVNRLKEAAMRDVQPIYVERGQMIVRRYDLVTEEHVQIVKDLGLLKERPNYGSALGFLILVTVMMGLFGFHLRQKNGEVLKNESRLALLGLVVILLTGLAKTASIIPFEAAGYLIPVALATMLIGILLDVYVAIMAALFLSVIVGLIMGQEFKFALVALTGGMTGAFSVGRAGERAALTRAGLWVGLVTFATILGLGLLRSDAYMITYSFVGLINGIMSAVGTIGLFPYLESLFGVTSSIRLLELSNPNQPLLRKLLMEAPGTYHHSMIVGNLSEAVVEAIGGDSLVTRVGAQYHDIGKTKRPYFFIENQYGGDNPHDKLAPSLSTLILTSHVKDGVDLAKKHKLPEKVIAFIREHHGTTLAGYFYHKAKESMKDGEPCDEEDFRYPGPKPQTRESAVVMLADSVEAAVRTLNRPTPGRIEGLVRKIVKDRLSDGQLDESNITLRDLDKISDAFVQVLTGIYHKRVDYPDPENILHEIDGKKASVSSGPRH